MKAIANGSATPAVLQRGSNSAQTICTAFDDSSTAPFALLLPIPCFLCSLASRSEAAHVQRQVKPVLLCGHATPEPTNSGVATAREHARIELADAAT